MLRRRPLSGTLAVMSAALVALTAVLFAGAAGATPRVASQQAGIGKPDVQLAIAHAVSPPLRDLPHVPQSSGVQRDRPLRLLPVPHGANVQPDPVVQSSAPGPKVGTT